VVLGIVTLLLGILIPVLSKARRQALQVACLSNVRQITVALIAYANDHRGCFPTSASALKVQDEDWVHWQPNRDLNESRLWPYMGGDQNVLKCPMGVPERARDLTPPYPFSYSVNMLFTGLIDLDIAPPWNTPPSRLSGTVRASEKMLVVEEDASAISDGAWYPTNRKYWVGNRMPYVSVRHDGDGREHSGFEDFPIYVGRGNIGFADGHADFVDRRNGMAEYYFNPPYDGPVPMR